MFLSTQEVRNLGKQYFNNVAICTEKTTANDPKRRSVVFRDYDPSSAVALRDFFANKFAELGVQNTVKLTSGCYVRVIAYMP